MFFPRRRRVRRSAQRLVVVLAVLAIAAAALIPALSNAMGRTDPAMWVELCAADGTRRIAIDATRGEPVEGSSQSASHIGEHCPFCHLDPVPAALPAAPAPFVPQALSHAEFPALFYAAPRPLFAWAPARSRAPPQAA